MRPANERRHYKVTLSLIGWRQTLNQPWNSILLVQLYPLKMVVRTTSTVQINFLFWWLYVKMATGFVKTKADTGCPGYKKSSYYFYYYNSKGNLDYMKNCQDEKRVNDLACGRIKSVIKMYTLIKQFNTQIAKLMAPTWGPPGSCRSQMGPMLAPWTLLSGYGSKYLFVLMHMSLEYWCKLNDWHHSKV